MVTRFEDIVKALVRRDLVAIPRLQALTLSELQRIDIDSEAVFLEKQYLDLNAVALLRERGTVVLFRSCSDEFRKQLFDNGIPVQCGIEIAEQLDTVVLVPRTELERAIEKARKDLREYVEAKERERKRELSLEDLIKIVEEYRENIRKAFG